MICWLFVLIRLVVAGTKFRRNLLLENLALRHQRGSSLFSVEWQLALGGVILGFAKKAPPCGRGATTPGRTKPKTSSKRIRGKMLHPCCTNVAPNVAP